MIASSLLLIQLAGHGRFDKARRDAIDGHVAACDLLRQRLGEADEASLRGAIICLTRIARHTDNGGDVDDAAVAAAHHGMESVRA